MARRKITRRKTRIPIEETIKDELGIEIRDIGQDEKIDEKKIENEDKQKDGDEKKIENEDKQKDRDEKKIDNEKKDEDKQKDRDEDKTVDEIKRDVDGLPISELSSLPKSSYEVISKSKKIVVVKMIKDITTDNKTYKDGSCYMMPLA